MANRYAVATGNWSNVATWDGGTTLPQAADSVCANGYTVTIDQDVTVVLITTAALGAGAAGGGFAVSTARTITANITAGSTACLTASHTSGNTVTVNGNVTGGYANLSLCLLILSTGMVVIVGNVNGGVASSSYGINCQGSGTVTITGNLTGGTSGNAFAIYRLSSCNLNIIGNVTGGIGASSHGIQNASSGGIITVVGNITGGTGSPSIGLNDISAVTVVTGNIIASANNNGLISTGHVRLNGSSYANASGFCGLKSSVIAYENGESKFTQYAEAGAVIPTYSGGVITHYGDNVSSGHPIESNVRHGVVYGQISELTGTCHVPAAASVLYGVPVDATTGTAAVNAAAIAAIVAEITGNGPYTVTLTVTDDNSDPVQGAVVRLSKTGEAYTATTNASGIAAFSLDAATWTVAITAGGSYAFTPTSLVVSANTSQTYQLTDNAPAAPASPLLSTGYVDCYGLDGAVEADVDVEIELTSGPGTVGYALDKGTYTATSAVNGRATHSGFVRGATYRARRGELGKWVSFTVPDAGTFTMPELLGQP